MNLDDLGSFSNFDTQDMLGHINGLPDQLQTAWELGLRQELPAWSDIRQVLVAGMGGSAIGADLLASFAALEAKVPIIVHRDYGLPAWANGKHTLVIASSHSGNTEEVLSAFETAQNKGCPVLAITTGGELAKQAFQAGIPAWRFVHHGQPRAAVGYSFGLLLAALAHLDLLPDPSAQVYGAVQAMRSQQDALKADVPAARNPAKRYAGQLVGRWVVVFGSDLLAPVARRWKGQINEIAKAWAQFEVLPEANHNTSASILNPEALFSQVIALFLGCSSSHPRNRLRSDLARQAFLLEGINTDYIEGRGDTPLAQQWTCLHFGDYLAYYLAMAYGVDPTPVAPIEDIKQALQRR